jgi:uncharacterized membrane protein YcaP (DUF421 family)
MAWFAVLLLFLSFIGSKRSRLYNWIKNNPILLCKNGATIQRKDRHLLFWV